MKESLNMQKNRKLLMEDKITLYKYGGFSAQATPPIQLPPLVPPSFVDARFQDDYIGFQNIYNDPEYWMPPVALKTNNDQKEDVSPELTVDNTGTSEENKPTKSQEQQKQTLQELLREEGVDARITSSYRPNAQTSNGSVSHHSNKEMPALDIVPTNGKSFDELILQMLMNPRIMQWFKDNKWGIHSEVSKDQWNAFTTGAHLHLGPDKVAVKGLQAIVKNYQEGKQENLWKYKLS